MYASLFCKPGCGILFIDINSVDYSATDCLHGHIGICTNFWWIIIWLMMAVRVPLLLIILTHKKCKLC